ncbi:helix-turn-helix domain-containing protein, partial [Enterobacter cloacae]|nr:helix-turn-helix domain-containing protein [Enterobacter cloacae]HCJ6523458.1 helix-turn-helix domain-containing protein [Enterobacter cloacae]
MNHKELHVINLLEWIEDNLDENISAEDIVLKSGYTKWHLQKMFKSYTGLTMIQYVRMRRLSKAAMALKYSKKTIAELIDVYRFKSQSSFTRAFTSFYGMSPARFREDKNLRLGPFIHKYNPLYQAQKITCEYVSFDHLITYGIKADYVCPISEIKQPHRSYRKNKRKEFISENNLQNTEVFTLGLFHPLDSENLLCEFYLGCQSSDKQFETLPVVSGDYIKFDYYGVEDGIYDFVMSIYFKYFESYNILRRNTYDIEIFKYINDETVNYSYLIPIVFDANSLLVLTHSVD